MREAKPLLVTKYCEYCDWVQIRIPFGVKRQRPRHVNANGINVTFTLSESLDAGEI